VFFGKRSKISSFFYKHLFGFPYSKISNLEKVSIGGRGLKNVVETFLKFFLEVFQALNPKAFLHLPKKRWNLLVFTLYSPANFCIVSEEIELFYSILRITLYLSWE